MVESTRERTFIMIKPDGVQRGLIGSIMQRFETKGFKLAAMKLCQPGKAHFEEHYADLAGKKFFPGLIEYAASGPVCAMVWEVTTLFSPDVRFSVPLNHLTLSQALSVVTSASMSEETLSTVPMLSNPPTRKSLSGSRMRNSSNGNPTPTHGSTSELDRSLNLLRNCEISIGRLQHVVVNDSAKILNTTNVYRVTR